MPPKSTARSGLEATRALPRAAHNSKLAKQPSIRKHTLGDVLMLKNVSKADCGPAQPLLRGINLARFLCERCPFDTVHPRSQPSADLDPKAEVIEPSPAAVPPDSNTGVHHEPLKRGASDERPSE